MDAIHYKIKNNGKYVSKAVYTILGINLRDKKEFMKDLKKVYRAISKEEAETEFDLLEEKWSKKYPIVIKSWRNKWDNLSNYFKYPEHIIKVIYTTNIIESVHRQFRKLTKTKGAFQNEKQLIKITLYGYSKC